jgi:acyl-CoA thioesterase FadM
MFQTTLTIPQSLIEQQYNHLHHADALRLLEEGRLKFLDFLGLPQSELLKDDCFLVLIRCDVEFLRELKSGEVRCTVSVTKLKKNQAFVLTQELLKPPFPEEKMGENASKLGRVAVQANIELVAMSGQSRRKRAIPEPLLARLVDCMGE